jgi:hypothetical protein
MTHEVEISKANNAEKHPLYYNMSLVERPDLMFLGEFRRTCPFFFMSPDKEALVMSLKLKAQNSLIGIQDILEAMDALSESQCYVPSVPDNAHGHVEKTVPECFQEFLFVHARQCQDQRDRYPVLSLAHLSA